MSNCTLCPRKCNVDRQLKNGYCGVGTLKIAKVALHFGEEPCISGENGSGTVFFSGCPLKCVFCQNTPISTYSYGKEISVQRLSEIFLQLQDRGANNINLVTPTQFSDKIISALDTVKGKLHIPVVYNCGGYESVETLKTLEGYIDIYLPDFKYADGELAGRYSGAADYPDVAKSAIAEMYRQVGKAEFSDNGIMTKGMLIRHMVLPSHRRDSMRVLDILKETLPVENIKISLLRQYTPYAKALEIKEIARKVTTFEYNAVADYAEGLGFDGFLQDKQSATMEMTPSWDLEGV